MTPSGRHTPHIRTARIGQKGGNMAQTTFAQALANVLALNDADKALLLQTLVALATAPTQTSVSAPALAPVQDAPKTRKPLPKAEDVDLGITIVKSSAKDNVFALTLGYGAGKAGAKLMLKQTDEDGKPWFKWDASLAEDGVRKGAWVGTYEHAKALGLTARSKTLTVPANWVQLGREQAERKAARKSA